MGRKSTEQEEEPLPDHLRCSRTDGRQWRCRRGVMEGLKLCETHYLQGRHRQNKEKVPDSLKLQRKSTNNNDNQNGVVSENVEIRAKLMMKNKKKRRRIQNSEDAIGPARKKKKNGDIRIELLTMILEREIQKKKKKKTKTKKNHREKKSNVMEEEEEEEEDELCYSEGELRRELPNGVMEIAPASSMHNVGSHSDVKVSSFDHRSVTLTPRYFRSKNVDRSTNVVSCGGNLKKGKRKKCHWCQSSDSLNLIKCSSCQKEFFCIDCIKERFGLV